jgi:xanthine/uracil permease
VSGFFSHQVIGVVITLIGVTLMPVPVEWGRGGSATVPGFHSPSNLAPAAFTLARTRRARAMPAGQGPRRPA